MGAGIYTIHLTYDEWAAMRDAIGARLVDLARRNECMSELDERIDLGPYRDARTRLDEAVRSG